MAQDFRELRVWKEAMELVAEVYSATRAMPADERFGLTAQLRRAAVSVPSCIAEGNARQSTADYLRFLSMAAGSLAEVETQLALTEKLGFLQSSSIVPAYDRLRATTKLLQALRKALTKKLAADTPRSPFPVPRSPL